MRGLAPLVAAPGPQLARRSARDIAAEHAARRSLSVGRAGFGAAGEPGAALAFGFAVEGCIGTAAAGGVPGQSRPVVATGLTRGVPPRPATRHDQEEAMSPAER
jgi:hypothetical protein